MDEGYNYYNNNNNLIIDSPQISYDVISSIPFFPNYSFKSSLIKYLFFKSSFIKLINNIHKNTSEFTKNINNKILISVGTENKILVYDDSFHMIDNINLHYWINNLEHSDPDNDNDNLKIIVCTKNEIYIIYFSNDNLFNSHLSLKKGNFNFLLKINNNQFLICEEKFVSMEKEGFNILNNINFNKCFEGYYREGIKLNDNLIAFTSNKVNSRGGDKLIIYDIFKELIVFEKYGYSFILSSNGLIIFEKQNYKILLCACKKYTKGQKNGIFLMNLNYILNSSYRGNHYTKFFDTKDFEIHCFHQISILKEISILREEVLNEKTNFFFAGGLDKKKRKGNIRLYKLINYDNFKIEEIDNIIFYNLKGAVNCITQFGNDNNFVISCWDGNIYSLHFSLDSYVYFDEKIRNESFLNFFI